MAGITIPVKGKTLYAGCEVDKTFHVPLDEVLNEAKLTELFNEIPKEQRECAEYEDTMYFSYTEAIKDYAYKLIEEKIGSKHEKAQRVLKVMAHFIKELEGYDLDESVIYDDIKVNFEGNDDIPVKDPIAMWLNKEGKTVQVPIDDVLNEAKLTYLYGQLPEDEDPTDTMYESYASAIMDYAETCQEKGYTTDHPMAKRLLKVVAHINKLEGIGGETGTEEDGLSYGRYRQVKQGFEANKEK